MRVYHMSGAGNDFMVIDARGQVLDFPAIATKLCAASGADGFMAVTGSKTADFKLHFYNSDGSRGEMCGNGARCICKFAYDLGIAGEHMTVETDAGLVSGWRLAEDRYRVKLNAPSVVDLVRKENCAYVELGDPGIPHVVTEIPGLTWDRAEDLRQLGKSLRYDPAFPKGANINFYTVLGEGHVRVLTYERGVEDYTLACGTGSASVAVVLSRQGKLPGKLLTVENRGGILAVALCDDGIFLEGPAQTLDVNEL